MESKSSSFWQRGLICGASRPLPTPVRFLSHPRNFSGASADSPRMTSSRRHEVLLSLFQTRPELAAEALALLGVAVPSPVRVRTDSADLTQTTPTEYRADLVVVLEQAAGAALGIVVRRHAHAVDSQGRDGFDGCGGVCGWLTWIADSDA